MDSLIDSPCILVCIEFLYFVEADLCKHIVYCNILQAVILLIPVPVVCVGSIGHFFGLERGLRGKVFITPLDPNHKSDLVKDCIQVIQLIDRFKCRERKALHPVQWQFLLDRNLSTADLPSLLSICRSNFHEFDNVNRVTALHRLARLGPGPGADVQQRLLEELKVQQLAILYGPWDASWHPGHQS